MGWIIKSSSGWCSEVYRTKGEARNRLRRLADVAPHPGDRGLAQAADSVRLSDDTRFWICKETSPKSEVETP